MDAARLTRAADFIWTAARADDWRKPWPEFSGTRYEAKAKREGRVPCYLIFRRLGMIPKSMSSTDRVDTGFRKSCHQ